MQGEVPPPLYISLPPVNLCVACPTSHSTYRWIHTRFQALFTHVLVLGVSASARTAPRARLPCLLLSATEKERNSRRYIPLYSLFHWHSRTTQRHTISRVQKPLFDERKENERERRDGKEMTLTGLVADCPLLRSVTICSIPPHLLQNSSFHFGLSRDPQTGTTAKLSRTRSNLINNKEHFKVQCK